MVLDLSGSPHLKIINKTTRLICFILFVCALLRVVLLLIEIYFNDLIVSSPILVSTSRHGSLCWADHPS